jgi:hypothetical protein
MSDIFTGYPVTFGKSNPQPADVYVRPLLTNMAISYIQEEGTTYDKVFPYNPVQTQSGFFALYNKGDFMRSMTQARQDGRHDDMGFNVDLSGTYACKTYGLKKTAGGQTMAAYQSPIPLDKASVRFLSRAAKLRREIAFANIAFATASWTNYTTPSILWSDPSSTPIEDVRTAKQIVLKSTGMMPNKLTLGRAVYDVLCNHPEILQRVGIGATTGEMPRVVMKITLAKIFEVDEIVVADLVYETAAKGATSAMDFVVGKHALLTYTTASPSIEEPSAGYTFTWAGYTGNAEGVMVRSGYNMEDQYNWWTVDHAEDFKITAADLGYLFYNVVA